MNRHLSTLELEEGATATDIKAAYRDLSKVWHPDRFAHDPKLQSKAQERLKEINKAYSELKDYDGKMEITTEGSLAALYRAPKQHKLDFEYYSIMAAAVVLIAVIILFLRSEMYKADLKTPHPRPALNR